MAKKTVLVAGQPVVAADNDAQRQIAALEIEERELRLQDLRFRVENEKARRAQMVATHKAQTATLLKAQADIEAGQSICKHHKGGRNIDNFFQGNDANYCVAKHMYPWGEMGVHCTRCGKQWVKPLGVLQKQQQPENFAAAKADPLELQRQQAEYVAACNFPTDNETSGSQLFLNAVPVVYEHEAA